MKIVTNSFAQLILASFIVALFSCSKGSDIVLDFKVKTDSISISNTTLVASGTITDVGPGILDYGHCWSKDPKPDITKSKSSLGSLTAPKSFSTVVSDLVEGYYYFRSYATDGTTTKYGDERKIFYLPPNAFIDKEGVIYHTVTIGNQIWTKENSRATKYFDGTPISSAYSYKNLDANAETYGRLYTWDAVMKYSTLENAQGLCPQGWHIPSDADWSELVTFLGGETVAGGKMKINDRPMWEAPNIGADNSSGFSAVPGGKNVNGAYTELGLSGYYWSSSQSTTQFTRAWRRYIGNSDATINRYPELKTNAFSIRCIKNK